MTNPTKSGGVPLDQNYEITDIDWASLVRVMEDCKRFQESPAWLEVVGGEDPRIDRRAVHGWSIEASAGHDFWLTRNGHGAGFWDGDWREPYGIALDKLAKSFGEVSLYLGDDGRIYA